MAGRRTRGKTGTAGHLVSQPSSRPTFWRNCTQCGERYARRHKNHRYCDHCYTQLAAHQTARRTTQITTTLPGRQT